MHTDWLIDWKTFCFKCLKTNEVPTADAWHIPAFGRKQWGVEKHLSNDHNRWKQNESRILPGRFVWQTRAVHWFRVLFLWCLHWDLNHVLVKGKEASTKLGSGWSNQMLWSRKSWLKKRKSRNSWFGEGHSTMTCVPSSRWGFCLSWHHGGLLPSSWDAGWVCGGAAFFLQHCPQQLGQESSFTSWWVRHFSHSESKRQFMLDLVCFW